MTHATADSPDRQIGARIAAIRKRQAMTRVELAAALGMDQSLLSRSERVRCASTTP